MKNGILLLSLLSASVALADGGVQPKALLDPAVPGAAAQVRANGGCDAQLATAFDGDALVATLAPGDAAWPGFAIVPAGGAPAWDLSLYGHIEVKVTNLGDRQETLNLRVDNASTPENRNPWNAEMAKLAPGERKAR